MKLMMHTRLAALLLLAVATCAHAGPAEIHALEEQLAAVDARIEETKDGMRQALKEYGSDAGQYGISLRALKRERTQIERDLRRAIAEQREREVQTESLPLLNTSPSVTNR